MSAERQSTQPEIGDDELQERLEQASLLYMEADVEVEKLLKKRTIAWIAFNFLREQLSERERPLR